jgi:preprotein translocase SecF subunit
MKVIHFYQKRYVYFTISICLILIGVIASFVNGIQLDIQFKGGAIIKYSYTGTIDTDKASSVAESTLGRSADAFLQSDLLGQDKKISINLAGNEAITSDEQAALSAALIKEFPDSKLALSESLVVEPFIGRRFFERGMIAIVLSFALILIYVGVRFKRISGLSAGVMSIIALVHDALMVTVAFIFFKIPLNDSFIAAVLTIIGFSINDTIVIYDRIRENSRILTKLTPEELVDRSITQSFTRSLNTNVAVFVSITIVYIFAQIYQIESVKSFALPMMFGTISGCYSTICIAGPLWTMWQNHKLKNKTAKA